MNQNDVEKRLAELETATEWLIVAGEAFEARIRALEAHNLAIMLQLKEADRVIKDIADHLEQLDGSVFTLTRFPR